MVLTGGDRAPVQVRPFSWGGGAWVQAGFHRPFCKAQMLPVQGLLDSKPGQVAKGTGSTHPKPPSAPCPRVLRGGIRAPGNSRTLATPVASLRGAHRLTLLSHHTVPRTVVWAEGTGHPRAGIQQGSSCPAPCSAQPSRARGALRIATRPASLGPITSIAAASCALLDL